MKEIVRMGKTYVMRTDEEIRAACEEVETRIASGEKVMTACDKVGVPYGTLNSWRSRSAKNLRYKEVQALVDGGVSANEACKKIGVSFGNYRSWKHHSKKKAERLALRTEQANPNPVLHTINVMGNAYDYDHDKDGAPMVVLIGKEATITKALDSLTQMWSRLNG